MLFAESLYSAINAIKANATRSFLTSLAIIIGTASVIAMIAIGEGAQNALNNEIDNLGGRVLSVYASQRKRGGVTYGSNPLIIKDAEALRNDKNTLQKHQDQFPDPDIKNLYLYLTESIQKNNEQSKL